MREVPLTCTRRNARIKAQMEKNSYWNQDQQTTVVKLDSILSAVSSSNTQHAIDDIHDILEAYYKVVRKRFVDHICVQAVGDPLVSEIQAPTTVFSSTFVGMLNEEQLNAIAGEESGTARRREELKLKIDNLKLGKKIA